jgi:2,4-dienoyl-CoA reductase-like NADH-dependent reductase (Old Yellow Enzyme family)
MTAGAPDAGGADPLFRPGRIGTLQIRNRIVRAATSESMATVAGEVTSQLERLYATLAANDVGLIITGQLYCHRRGKYAVGQTGIDHDGLVAGLRRLADGVHAAGGTVFAQLAHAGSQTRVPGEVPLAPSPVPNPLTGAEVEAATAEELREKVAAFGAAAERAVAAGFDGVHIHGANGYLISEFSSPVTNRRTDDWGGSPRGRDRFALEVVRAVRAAVGPAFPVSMKLGFADSMAGGLDQREGVDRAARLAAAGLDAIEVSCNLMRAPSDSAHQYVAVDRRRAVTDWLLHRVASGPAAEAYFRPWAASLRAATDVPIILVGGMRSAATMRDVLRSGDADFVAMARPFIREPDLAAQIARGRESVFDCTSCNLCLMHEGHHSLQCWRVPRRRLLQHAAYRLAGGFRRAPVRPVQRHS